MNALNLDIEDLVRPGRKPLPLEVEHVREIQPADLAMLAVGRGTKPPELKKLTERHHGLARLIAAGTRPSEAAVIMGYEPTRASILQSDPAFEELVEFYRESVDTQFAATMAQVEGLSTDVLLELRHRIETDAESFSNGELRELLKTGLDRTGYGPSSKQEVNVNLELGARIEAARKRALEARLAEARDVTPLGLDASAPEAEILDD